MSSVWVSMSLLSALLAPAGFLDDHVFEGRCLVDAVSKGLCQLTMLFGRLPGHEVLDRLPLAGDQPPVRVLRRAAYLVDDVPLDALGDVVAQAFVRLQELLAHAG